MVGIFGVLSKKILEGNNSTFGAGLGLSVLIDFATQKLSSRGGIEKATSSNLQLTHRDRGREKKSAKKARVERRQICELNIGTMPDKESSSVLEFIAFVLVCLPYAFKTQSYAVKDSENRRGLRDNRQSSQILLTDSHQEHLVPSVTSFVAGAVGGRFS
ncbi:hypothetical protein B0H14DRAFT_2560564 [Mycena olivaceomarginata]|nr:hypothetical protein B0H14DRAFT_2560564 [Mycena olivaceomarginata]